MKKSLPIIIALIVLLGAGFAYWYFFFNGPGNTVPLNRAPSASNGFVPLNRNQGTSNPSNSSNNQPSNNQTASTTQGTSANTPIPSLRLLSNTPVGGYGASTTASTTVFRWIDRGRGNVLQTKSNSLNIDTISNTVLPKIYSSFWNKNLTAFVGSMLTDESDSISSVYAELKKNVTASSSDTQMTPFALKGKNLPDNILAIALSPKSDKVFLLVNEANTSVGYISNIDGGSMTKIFSTPLTQVNVEWPEDNTIAITTKGSQLQSGFLYFVNPKTGKFRKIIGPVPGLSAKVSHDAKFVIASGGTTGGSLNTWIYSVGTTTPADAIVRTLADKCVWGNFYKSIVYCAVPAQQQNATYPDDWYRGSVSFVDKIWQINATNGEVHLISNIVDQSDRVIDAFNLTLDNKDNFLLFTNKNDLSLWSLDLVINH